MASKNQVTLTFAGDADKLTKAADRAGASLEEFGDDAKRASKSLDDVGEAAGTLDTRAMGFRDTITGVQDTMAGWGQLSEGDVAGGLLTLGAGVGDLASGIENLGVHLIKNAGQMVKTSAVWVAESAKQAAAVAASVARQVAAWVLLGVQSLLNAAKVAAAWLISIGPLILIGLAVAALVYLIIKHWDTIKRVVAQGAEWIKAKVTAAGTALKSGFSTALSFVAGLFRRYISIYTTIFSTIVGAARRVFGGITSAIVAPFTNAYAGVRSAWNRYLGGKGFNVPSWVPGIGGREFRIPRLAEGGIIPAAPGGRLINVSEAGKAEAIIPLDRLDSMLSGRGANSAPTLTLRSDGTRIGNLILEVVREAVSVRGGDVQVALGRR